MTYTFFKNPNGAGRFASRLAYMAHAEIAAVSSEYESKIDRGEVTDLAATQKEFNVKLEAAKKNLFDKKSAEIDEVIQKLDEAEAKKDIKGKKALEKQRDELLKERAKMRGEIDAEIAAANASLVEKFNQFIEERKRKAEEFGKKISAELMVARGQTAKEDAQKIAGEANLPYAYDVTMPFVVTEGGVQKERVVHWKQEQVAAATIAMLAAIYIEQGEDAAKKKAAEMKAEAETKNGSVDYFTWHQTMGGDTEGSFADVLAKGICPPNVGPEIFGSAVGFLQSAKGLFEKANQYYKQYEAFITAAIKNSQPLLSPTMWAQQFAPEALEKSVELNKDSSPEEKEKYKQQLIESVLAQIARPAKKMELKTSSIGPAGQPSTTVSESDDPELMKAYEARKASFRAVLSGVLDANKDAPEHWDTIVKMTLASICRPDNVERDKYQFKLADINDPAITGDSPRFTRGREIYGDLGAKLDEVSKKYISGLIMGADIGYTGMYFWSPYLTKVDGKTVNFATVYKDYVRTALAGDGKIAREIADAREQSGMMLLSPGMSAFVDESKLTAEAKANITADYEKRIAEIIRKNLRDPFDLSTDYPNIDTSSQPAPANAPAAAPVAVAAANAPTQAPAPANAPAQATPSSPASTQNAPAASPAVAASSAPTNAPATKVSAAPAAPEKKDEETPAARFAKLSNEEKRALGGPAVQIARGGAEVVVRDIEANLKRPDASAIPGGEYLTPAGVRVKISSENARPKVEITGLTADAKKKLPEGQTAEGIASIETDGRDASA